MTHSHPAAVMARLAEIEQDLGERQKIKVEDRGYETPCWIWQAALSNGYGDGWFNGEHMYAHRWAYRALVGTLPELGLHLDHLCRVRACCNPLHVEPVTPQMNARRGAKSKLSLADIDVILASNESYRRLAMRFGVTNQTISYYKGGAYARRAAA